ncbi:Na(+)/H(+) antiporter NhaA 2 [Rhodococcus sp. RD6.2]|uniref:Na+/H+ antiporter NhaA n=1 Tax=Rhodococcus sp. RD6.2 TaxID=260936 RepID=UPI00063B7970|nr:Na+/H+ antiporter NhaA [Rhodococcus sp. RD6.2]CRK52004.1 Na(+)/H(+) antiporter NhaA 2 [Rhodococcus sp. RD6.2]
MSRPFANLPLFTPGSWPETSRIAAILRKETVGGILLLIAAATALIWANSPWSASYYTISDFTIGPAGLHLNLPLSLWAADGLLAIFFFVVGLELKREFVAGDLRDPRRAALPVMAAIGGMLVPAVIFVVVTVSSGSGGVHGWAIPTATDIAFAVAILAVISSHLPLALRTFLLTLAVVDDLLAITVIAVFYTDEIHFAYLGAALIPLVLFAIAVQKRIRTWWILIPLAVVTWALLHQSGIHATIAGVALGLTVPVLRSKAAGGPDAGPGLAEHFEHRIRPFSAGFAVPVFAFFAAGVTVGGIDGFLNTLTDPVAIGIIAGLVIGKAVGITGASYLTAKVTRTGLSEGLRWLDVAAVALLGGIGFTVSLLIGDLAFAGDETRIDHVKVGVLVGSLASALLATVALRIRNRAHRELYERQSNDSDNDGIPDVYQRP